MLRITTDREILEAADLFLSHMEKRMVYILGHEGEDVSYPDPIDSTTGPSVSQDPLDCIIQDDMDDYIDEREIPIDDMIRI